MKPTTQIALDWAIRCFGVDHVFDQPTRSLRLAEESIELIQAYKIPKEKAHALVEMVYSRPAGQVPQELGGVAMTLAVLCAVRDSDIDDYFQTELRRVLRKTPQDFAARNQEKIDLGMKA